MTENLHRDALTARLFLRAMLPVIKVVLEEDPKMAGCFTGVTTRLRFTAAQPDAPPLTATLNVENGKLAGIDYADTDPVQTEFAFGSPEKMNAFFKGKAVIPRIRGWGRPGLIVKWIRMLLFLKLLMPDNRPSDPEKRRLKVKLSFYMVTTALSQYNKAGDPDMREWTGRQPERIYQISVEPEGIAAYLRVKAGKTKAGRGVYTRRRPFVHMRFNGVDGAFPVILNDVDMVTAMRDNLLSVEGSPEYGSDIGNFMTRIQNLMT